MQTNRQNIVSKLDILHVPPRSPNQGDIFLVGNVASWLRGDFIGHVNDVAIYSNMWKFYHIDEYVAILNTANILESKKQVNTEDEFYNSLVHFGI